MVKKDITKSNPQGLTGELPAGKNFSAASATTPQKDLRELNRRLSYRAYILDTTLSFITDFAYIFDRDGRFAYANRPLLDLLEITLDEIVGKNFFDLNYPSDLAEKLQRQIRQIFDTKQTIKDETPFTSPAGKFGYYEYIFNPIFDGNGAVKLVAGSTRDITRHRKAEEKLQASEERFRLLIESATDFAIFTIAIDGVIDYWNTGAEKVFGWAESEVLGQPIEIIFTPEDRAAGVPEEEMKTARRAGHAPDERFHLRKDGSRFYVSGVMTPLKNADGELQGFVKIARDISERIKTEKMRRDKELLQKLVGAQEDERKRIARDLHDELGQKVTALRLKIEAIKKTCGDGEICAKIAETQKIAENIDYDVDFLAWELRPGALNDLGLADALKNYIREWSRYAGVPAEFHTSGLKQTRLAPEIETNLYRIAQEALNNIYKHARAKKADVMLEKRGDSIALIIEDDGTGFDLADKTTDDKDIGLIGIRERAEIIGGTAEIESRKGKGTTIFVRVPAAIKKQENI